MRAGSGPAKLLGRAQQTVLTMAGFAADDVATAVHPAEISAFFPIYYRLQFTRSMKQSCSSCRTDRNSSMLPEDHSSNLENQQDGFHELI